MPSIDNNTIHPSVLNTTQRPVEGAATSKVAANAPTGDVQGVAPVTSHLLSAERSTDAPYLPNPSGARVSAADAHAVANSVEEAGFFSTGFLLLALANAEASSRSGSMNLKRIANRMQNDFNRDKFESVKRQIAAEKGSSILDVVGQVGGMLGALVIGGGMAKGLKKYGLETAGQAVMFSGSQVISSSMTAANKNAFFGAQDSAERLEQSGIESQLDVIRQIADAANSMQDEVKSQAEKAVNGFSELLQQRASLSSKINS